MATKIGGLFVNVLARTAKFDNNIQKSTGRSKAFSAALKVTAIAMKALGAAVVAFGVFKVVKGSLEDIDRLAKTSKRLKIDINDLVAFELAAAQSGVESEKFTKAIETMQKVIGEGLIRGTGTAIDIITDKDGLNLNFVTVAGMEAADMFTHLGGEINALENQSRRMASFRGLFKTDLGNLFADPGNIKRLRELFRGIPITGEGRAESLLDSLAETVAVAQQQKRRGILGIGTGASAIGPILFPARGTSPEQWMNDVITVLNRISTSLRGSNPATPALE